MTIEDKDLIENEALNEKEIFWAFTAYIFFIIPLISPYKTKHFVRYHIRQGLIFFIALILLSVLSAVLDRFFWKVVIFLFLFLIWCFGIIQTFLGRNRPLPLIGWLAKLLP